MKSLGCLILLIAVGMPSLLAQTATTPDVQQTIVRLQSRLDSLSKRLSVPAVVSKSARAEVEVLRSDIDLLCDQVAQLAASVSAVNAKTTAMSEMLADIETLKAENEQLQARLAQMSPAVASLDDNVAPRPNRSGEPVVSDPSTMPLGLNLAGYVAASGVADNGGSNSNFGVDQAEVSIGRSNDSPASVLAEVECVSDGTGGFEVQLEQGYVAYAFGQAKAVTLSLGKFNSPLGWEAVDAPDMYQYSYAAISNCVPSNLTGLRVEVQVTPTVGLSSFLVNGWDVNTDNNRDKTVGGQIAFTPTEQFDIRSGLIYGSEQDNNVSSKRTLLDLNFTVSPSARWMLGGELQSGQESKSLEDGGTARWRGGLFTNQFMLSESVGLTLRYDYLDDIHGWQTGTAQQIHGFTVSPSIAPLNGLRFLVEGKYQKSNADGFVSSSGSPEDHHLSFACGCTYSM